MPGSGGAWGGPQGFFPNGPPQPMWGPPQGNEASPGFPPQINGRPPPHDINFRLKEDQRRRQQEYSQALAEQVRQRELQKQQEKEARRREDAAFDALHGMMPASGQPARDRGLFDGLGQSNPVQRTNFGRGRREPAAAAPYGGPNATMGVFPPPQVPSIDINHPPLQPQVAWSGHAEALGFVEPQPQYYGDIGHTPRQDMQRNNNPSINPPPPFQPPIHQAQALGGRRIRSDLHAGGSGGDDTQKQLRFQQQLDMQETLRRQIEEKQRQKLEEKRQREEDERREMEKFELEKRRQQEEQERIKDERRRKAQADEEHFLMQQQQLAAANAAAQEQKNQRHHHSPFKEQVSIAPQRPSPVRTQPTEPLVRIAPKNPFTNSRAHLFQDPPSPPQQRHQQTRFNATEAVPHAQYRGVQDPQVIQQQNAVDTRVLLEQYEQVRAELERQRHLVEMLHAKMQQTQHPRDELPRELPTISDLEQLRQELRDELQQREAQHRQELEALRRQQQVPQHQVSPSKHSGQPQQERDTTRSTTRGPRRRHDAFVQDALSDDESLEQSLSHANQKVSPTSSNHRKLQGSLSAASLQCESQLVFFDGRVQKPKPIDPPRQLEHVIHEEQAIDEAQLEDSVNPLPPKDRNQGIDNQSEAVTSTRSTTYGQNDTLGFFIKRLDQHEDEPIRYQSRTSLDVSRSESQLHFPVDPAMLEDMDNDSDVDESLDGEALEAIFQRNVRRHEILTGFEIQSQQRVLEPRYWEELSKKLRDIPEHRKIQAEPMLAASSRWMPTHGVH